MNAGPEKQESDVKKAFNASAKRHRLRGIMASVALVATSLTGIFAPVSGAPADENVPVAPVPTVTQPKAPPPTTSPPTTSPPTTQPPAPVPEPQQCAPSLPYQQGWVGADGNISVRLPDGRMLWLFGDTFVRNDDQITRVGAPMINNSVGIASCDSNNQGIVNYYWPGKGTPMQGSVFTPPPGSNAGEYWPMDAIVHEGTLYVFLSKIVIHGSFDFKSVGTDIAVIPNPMDDPSQWQINYTSFMDSDLIVPGASIVQQDDGYVYAFSNVHGPGFGSNPVVLMRFPAENLTAPAAAMQYYAQDGSWKEGANIADAAIIMENGSEGMTIRYHPELREWVKVSDNAGYAAISVTVQTAPEMTGPWSAPVSVYDIPEVQPAANADGGRFCYSIREQPEYETAGQLVITYACNGKQQPTDMSLYIPKFVTVPAPKAAPKPVYKF